MRALPTTLLAAGVIALGGLAVAAEIRNAHVLTVQLPDGTVEHIHYIGDTPPKVSFQSAPASMVAFAPMMDPAGPDPAFAQMARMSAAMDQQAAMMLQQAHSLQARALAGPGGLVSVDMSALPPGAQGYSMVSTMSGSGVCTRSVQYTSAGDGQAPKVLTKTSGDCGAATSTSLPAARPAPMARPAPAASPEAPRMTEASYHPGAGALVQGRSDP